MTTGPFDRGWLTQSYIMNRHAHFGTQKTPRPTHTKFTGLKRGRERGAIRNPERTGLVKNFMERGKGKASDSTHTEGEEGTGRHGGRDATDGRGT